MHSLTFSNTAMRLPFFITFFTFLGTLVLAAPAEPASSLVDRQGILCNDAPNTGLTSTGINVCPGTTTNLTGASLSDLVSAATAVVG
ncbi:hypothetical protein F5888DRAFT_1742703 [Russula emetica]|nr:hypothetical protein F5888DRAFT_1742703 [Russula emetica]